MNSVLIFVIFMLVVLSVVAGLIFTGVIPDLFPKKVPTTATIAPAVVPVSSGEPSTVSSVATPRPAPSATSVTINAGAMTANAENPKLPGLIPIKAVAVPQGFSRFSAFTVDITNCKVFGTQPMYMMLATHEKVAIGTFLLINGTKTLTPEKGSTPPGPWFATTLVFGIYGGGSVLIDNVSITLDK